ncbi:MAG: diaminopimelate epimerase [Pseudomonadales bacterium]
MQLEFAKMHGLGNDFMVIDLVTQSCDLTPELVRAWSDRTTGVGFDQLLALEPPTDPEADFRYRIYNASGAEVEQCGNGARCAALFAARHRLSPKPRLLLQTLAGPITTFLCGDDMVEVDMGAPRLDPAQVPFDPTADDGSLALAGEAPHWRLTLHGQTFEFTALSMGNPHAVLFVDSAADAQVAEIGRALVAHPIFPEGANIGFCQVVDNGFLRLRVFERGVGETRACGTGACAAAVAAQLRGLAGSKVKVSLPGGKVRISWQGQGSTVRMRGPAVLVFEGRIEL